MCEVRVALSASPPVSRRTLMCVSMRPFFLPSPCWRRYNSVWRYVGPSEEGLTEVECSGTRRAARAVSNACRLFVSSGASLWCCSLFVVELELQEGGRRQGGFFRIAKSDAVLVFSRTTEHDHQCRRGGKNQAGRLVTPRTLPLGRPSLPLPMRIAVGRPRVPPARGAPIALGL